MDRDQGSDTTRDFRLRGYFMYAAELPEKARIALIACVRDEDADLADQLEAVLSTTVPLRGGESGAQGLPVLPERVDSSGSRHAGAFLIESEIGRGGMGVVYRARRTDGLIEQAVAVKFLHPVAVLGIEQERLLDECRTLSVLDHPGIARVLDAGRTEDGRTYLAMELVEGRPVTRWCDEHMLDVRARVRLFTDVCAAVAHAHHRLVLHSDIKPSNVMVSAGRPRLIDFGIARSLEFSEQDPVTRTLLFSPSNVTPEQLRGERLGVACDVYQLGALLYELLTGHRVHSESLDNLEALRSAVIVDLPTPPSERALATSRIEAAARRASSAAALSRSLSGDLDAIVMKCLRKSAAERYASADALAEDLQAWLDHRPISVRTGHRWYRARRSFMRHRVPILFAAVAVGALMGLAVLALTHQDRLEAAHHAVVVERDAAEQVLDFMVNVFRPLDPNDSRGPRTPVSEILERADRLLDTRDMAPRSRVQLLHALARAYAGTRALPRALERIERAQGLLDRVQTDPAEHAAINLERAGVLRGLGRLTEAESAVNSAIGSLAHLHEAVELMFRAQTQRVLIRYQQGRSAQARHEAMALLASAARREMPAVDEWAELEFALAADLQQSGHQQDAKALLEASQSRLSAAGPAQHIRLLQARLHRASLDLGDAVRAASAQGQALEVIDELRSILGANSPLLGQGWMVVGQARTVLNEPQAAIDAFGHASVVFDTAFPEGHPSRVWPWIEVGGLHLQVSELDEAESAYGLALARARQVPGALAAHEHIAVHGLAQVAMARREWETSRQWLAQIPDDSPAGRELQIHKFYSLLRIAQAQDDAEAVGVALRRLRQATGPAPSRTTSLACRLRWNQCAQQR